MEDAILSYVYVVKDFGKVLPGKTDYLIITILFLNVECSKLFLKICSLFRVFIKSSV